MKLGLIVILDGALADPDDLLAAAFAATQRHDEIMFVSPSRPRTTAEAELLRHVRDRVPRDDRDWLHLGLQIDVQTQHGLAINAALSRSSAEAVIVLDSGQVPLLHGIDAARAEMSRSRADVVVAFGGDSPAERTSLLAGAVGVMIRRGHFSCPQETGSLAATFLMFDAIVNAKALTISPFAMTKRVGSALTQMSLKQSVRACQRLVTDTALDPRDADAIIAGVINALDDRLGHLAAGEAWQVLDPLREIANTSPFSDRHRDLVKTQCPGGAAMLDAVVSLPRWQAGLWLEGASRAARANLTEQSARAICLSLWRGLRQSAHRPTLDAR